MELESKFWSWRSRYYLTRVLLAQIERNQSLPALLCKWGEDRGACGGGEMAISNQQMERHMGSFAP